MKFFGYAAIEGIAALAVSCSCGAMEAIDAHPRLGDRQDVTTFLSLLAIAPSNGWSITSVRYVLSGEIEQSRSGLSTSRVGPVMQVLRRAQVSTNSSVQRVGPIAYLTFVTTPPGERGVSIHVENDDIAIMQLYDRESTSQDMVILSCPGLFDHVSTLLSEMFPCHILQCSGAHHQVLPDETYESIAQRYALSQEVLRKLNSNRRLFPGSFVHLPLKRGIGKRVIQKAPIKTGTE